MCSVWRRRVREHSTMGADVYISIPEGDVICSGAGTRKFVYRRSSLWRLAIVGAICKPYNVCSQLLDMKCLPLFLYVTDIYKPLNVTDNYKPLNDTDIY